MSGISNQGMKVVNRSMTKENMTSDDPAEASEQQKLSGSMTRRMALSLVGLGGLGAMASGSATAQENEGQPFYNWKEDVDANEHSLSELGALMMASNSTAITDFAGENLSIGEDGTLAADRAWEDVDDDGLLETPDHEGIDVATTRTQSATATTLETDSAVVSGAARATTTQLGPKSQRTKSLPLFPTEGWEKLEDPIVTTDQTTGNQAGYPSVIHASKVFADPVDNWYMYWAGHDGGGIRLHTAPEITGPWSAYDQNPLFSADSSSEIGGGNHVSSPCAVWNPNTDKLRLYYHRAHSPNGTFVQETEVANSEDGLTFEKLDTALYCQLDGSWDDQERSYFEVMRDGSNWFGVYQGRDSFNNNTGYGWAWSSNGLDWETLEHPLFTEKLDGDQYEFPFSPSVTEFGGNIWVMGGITKTDGNQALRTMRLDSIESSQRGAANVQEIFGADLDWEVDGVTTPRVYYHDGRMYMFYTGKQNNPLRLKIGLAYHELEGYQ